MALIQVEVNVLQAAWCSYCTKPDFVVMLCMEYAMASLVAVSGAREIYVGFWAYYGWISLSKLMYYNTKEGYMLPMSSSLLYST